MKTFDNISSILKDDLVVEIKKDSKLSIAAAIFSIYAFEELKKQLESIKELRFIFTSPTFTKEVNQKEKREFYIPKITREKSLYGTEFEIRLRNELTQKAVAKECAEWIKQKVRFKSNTKNKNIPQFIHIQKSQEDNTQNYAYYPIDGFSSVDLGCEKGNNYFTIINKFENQETQKYINIFNNLWTDKEQVQDVTEQVIESITTVYNENSPEFIYFFTLFNIFNEFLNDINEDILPNEATGFKESAIWKKLYNFQKDASLAIISKLEKYNGCILADSVGLGKTFTALSVIKYYEGRNKNVLVLCPKKLTANWNIYKNNYKNNPIASDRLRYDVLYHTDLSRERGTSNGKDLSLINWGNYDLVVIDESHNFRNGGQVYRDKNTAELKNNRYNNLLEKVIKNGVKTKVLMLSATPVNNRFIDLKHQLELAYEGKAGEFNKKLGENKDIDRLFIDAQKAFNDWDSLPPEEKTTQNLLDFLSFDFISLLDEVTIARSRKHIEESYGLEEIGKFPDRLPPINLRPELTEKINYSEIFEKLLLLNLCLYTPSKYILRSKKEGYEEKYGRKMKQGHSFRQEDRELGIKHLMAINILKRLESSVYSFNQTINRIIARIDDVLLKIDNFKNNNDDDVVVSQEFTGEFNFDEEIDEMDAPEIGQKVQISLKDMDYLSWQYDLEEDLNIFNDLISKTSLIEPKEDKKLQTLIASITEKINNPINPGNKKVIVFTAFADTANYLYENISKYMKEKFNLNTALITGSINGQTTVKQIPKDINAVLTCFSPISKEKNLIYPNITEDLDILIATDCVSEGQNLQDCDYLVNYDIHWNPVRIIQRFGRIDRIGSKNNVIQLVNFWADMELDDYIKLKKRVESRMKIVTITADGDNIIDPEDDPDLEYRKQQLQRLQTEVVDIEEMGTGISITDLGLNEFRLDLLEYIKQNPNIDKNPMGMNAVVEETEDMPAGVIYILKNINTNTNINNINRLHPFYMVYIKDNGEIVFNHLKAKELLDKLRLACKGKNVPDKQICSIFNSKTKDGKDMKQYSQLLSQAINSIISVKDESDVDSLFSDGGTTALENEITGLKDFELICFLVVEGKTKC